MLDPGERLRRLGDPVQIRWTQERTDRIVRGLELKRRRRATLRILGAGITVLLLLLLSPLLWLRQSMTPASAPPSAPTATTVLPPRGVPPMAVPPITTVLRLHEGSIARKLSPDTELQIKQDGPRLAIIQLLKGGAFFDVVPGLGRVFRVEAGPVVVEVLGTAFSMERQAETVNVHVERGRVRVLWPGGRRELSAGQESLFPPPLEVPTRAAQGSTKSALPPPRPTAPPAPLEERSGQLLKEADTARLAGHPQEALDSLRIFLKEYQGDKRTALATFTEGRLLLELGRAEEAAKTFRRLEELQPQGPLHEDALAREVYAWDQAGEVEKARSRAEEYLRQYPNGSRRLLISKHGHLP